MPGRLVLRLLTLVTLAIPGVVLAAGYIFAWNQPWMNNLPGDTHPAPNGMVGVHRGSVRLQGMPHGELNGKGTAVLRPEDGTLHADQPDMAINALPGEVVYSEFLGGRWRHVIAVGDDCTVQVMTAARTPAARVWVHFPPERCLVLKD